MKVETGKCHEIFYRIICSPLNKSQHFGTRISGRVIYTYGIIMICTRDGGGSLFQSFAGISDAMG